MKDIILPNRINGKDQLGDGFGLKAIGLWAPYGTAIAMGLKQNETRGWTREFRGPIAIYQTKKLTDEAEEAYDELCGAFDANKAAGEKPLGIPRPSDCPRGAVVAIARSIGFYPVYHPSSSYSVTFFNGEGAKETRTLPPERGTPERLLGGYNTTAENPRYAWILTDVYALPEPVPVPTEGTIFQGIFDLPEEIAARCLSRYREFCFHRRPKCKVCGSIVGNADWRFLPKTGWEHRCAGESGAEKRDFRQASWFIPSEIQSRLAAFREGGFPEIGEGRPNPAKAQTASLFD
jgi:hypothetical protein